MKRGNFLGSPLFRIIAIAVFAVAVFAVFRLVPSMGGSEVRVVMWTSGEKMNYLKDVVAQYNRERHTVPSTGQRIHVDIYTVNSGPQSDYLVAKIRDRQDFPQGVEPPQIVSPSVDSWLTRVNYLTGKQIVDIENTKPLALTPVVIVTYEEMARALGWPQKELGWTDIIDLARNPDGWSAYPGAKVEWGKKPLLAWTDPAVSSTARTALFATYAAASGKSGDQLEVSDVHNPATRQYVQNLQGAVDHYFPETLKLQTKIFQGPRFLHFAPLEEYNLVWLKQGKVNAESVPGGSTETKPLDRRMVAIYPKEGTIWHNNPGAVLQNVDWSTPEQQEAASIFIDYLLEPEQQQKAMEWGFRPGNPSLGTGPYINAEYGIDPAQPKKLLGTMKPAVAEEILNGWQEVKKPGVVVLVLDTSGSMQGEKMDQAKQGALRFLDTVSVNNHVGMVTFASNIGTVVDIGPIAQKKFDIAGAIESSRAGGDTALYDAVRRGVEMADSYPLQEAAIRGVVVLSDGVRTSGRVRLSDLIDLRTSQEQAVTNFVGGDRDNKTNLHGAGLAFPTQNSVHIFSIGYGSDADLEVLRIFSEATNSTFNRATEKNISDVLEVFSKYF